MNHFFIQLYKLIIQSTKRKYIYNGATKLQNYDASFYEWAADNNNEVEK